MLIGGLNATNQGEYGTCYSEAAARIIIKILKHPSIKLIPDINNLDELTDSFATSATQPSAIESVSATAPSRREHNVTAKQELRSREIAGPETVAFGTEAKISGAMTAPRPRLNRLNGYEARLVNLQKEIQKCEEKVKLLWEDRYKYDNIINNPTDFAPEVFKDALEMDVGLDNKFYVNSENKQKQINDMIQIKKERLDYINADTEIKYIIDKQTEYFDQINNFIISRCGTDGFNVPRLLKWFVNYINNKSNFENNSLKDETITETEVCEPNPVKKCYISDANETRTFVTCSENSIDYDKLFNIFKALHTKLVDINKKLDFTNLYPIRSNYKFIESVLDNHLYLSIESAWIPESQFDNIFHINKNVDVLTNLSPNYYFCSGEPKANLRSKTNFHAYVLVGYDEDNYIIKNSWGIEWGEFGKLKIKKDNFIRNLCISSIDVIFFSELEPEQPEVVDVIPPPTVDPSAEGGSTRKQQKRTRKTRKQKKRSRKTRKQKKRSRT